MNTRQSLEENRNRKRSATSSSLGPSSSLPGPSSTSTPSSLSSLLSSPSSLLAALSLSLTSKGTETNYPALRQAILNQVEKGIDTEVPMSEIEILIPDIIQEISPNITHISSEALNVLQQACSSHIVGHFVNMWLPIVKDISTHITKDEKCVLLILKFPLELED